MYKNFDEVVAAVKQREIERTVAIAGAHDAPGEDKGHFAFL